MKQADQPSKIAFNVEAVRPEPSLPLLYRSVTWTTPRFPTIWCRTLLASRCISSARMTPAPSGRSGNLIARYGLPVVKRGRYIWSFIDWLDSWARGKTGHGAGQ